MTKLPTVAALLLLTSCASANIERIAMAPADTTPMPTSLRVDVAPSPELAADPMAGKASQALQAGLIKHYRKAGLQASAAGTGAATIRVRISRADQGDGVARFLVGFGAGRSSLKSDAVFEIAGQNGPAMTLTASAKGGRKPGLIAPGAIAAATGDVSRLAIGGGIGLLAQTREGLTHDADRSAKLIVKQTRQLYQARGWAWPT